VLSRSCWRASTTRGLTPPPSATRRPPLLRRRIGLFPRPAREPPGSHGQPNLRRSPSPGPCVDCRSMRRPRATKALVTAAELRRSQSAQRHQRKSGRRRCCCWSVKAAAAQSVTASAPGAAAPGPRDDFRARPAFVVAQASLLPGRQSRYTRIARTATTTAPRPSSTVPVLARHPDRASTRPAAGPPTIPLLISDIRSHANSVAGKCLRQHGGRARSARSNRSRIRNKQGPPVPERAPRRCCRNPSSRKLGLPLIETPHFCCAARRPLCRSSCRASARPAASRTPRSACRPRRGRAGAGAPGG